MTTSVDLNADMGESFGPWKMGEDAALLGIVTSANIACGSADRSASNWACTPEWEWVIAWCVLP